MNQLADEFLENKEEVVDLRTKSNHPLTFKYSEIFKSALLNANVADGRVLPYFKLNNNAPFYKAALEGAIESSNSFEAVKKELSNFYKTFQPKSIADWFKIEQSTSRELVSLPPWSAILPWRARSVQGFKYIIEQGTLKDNRKENLEGGIENGWAYCGPVSDSKLLIETERINNLIHSVKNKGYQRSLNKDGDIIATAIISNNNQWRWIVTNGYHRACVLAALGYKEIPIRVNIVVRENEVNYWPQVLDGFYTRDEALFIFKNIFNGL